MNIKEKVMKGLECCTEEAYHVGDNPCLECPYYETDETDSHPICYRRQMLEDVIAVLKGQQSEWISVDDALPTEKGQECWVWSNEWEEGAEPEWDIWEDDRGEPRRWANGPEEDRDFVASGWYTCTGMNITHWMPIETPKKPQPPKEGAEDA